MDTPAIHRIFVSELVAKNRSRRSGVAGSCI
jgi:hypothetical protein